MDKQEPARDKPEPRQFLLTFPPEHLARLNALARAAGCSTTELIRNIVIDVLRDDARAHEEETA